MKEKRKSQQTKLIPSTPFTCWPSRSTGVSSYDSYFYFSPFLFHSTSCFNIRPTTRPHTTHPSLNSYRSWGGGGVGWVTKRFKEWSWAIDLFLVVRRATVVPGQWIRPSFWRPNPTTKKRRAAKVNAVRVFTVREWSEGYTFTPK